MSGFAHTNDETNWESHLVNLHQTPEERREKYWLCKSLGANSYRARDMRDWRMSKLERHFNLKTGEVAGGL
jgi:hypothetical protein